MGGGSSAVTGQFVPVLAILALFAAIDDIARDLSNMGWLEPSQTANGYEGEFKLTLVVNKQTGFKDKLSISHSEIDNIVVNSINLWENEMETHCKNVNNNPFDLLIDEHMLDMSLQTRTQSLGECLAHYKIANPTFQVGDNHNCLRPTFNGISGNVDIYIVGLVDHTLFKTIDNLYYESIAGLTIFYDSNNNILSTTDTTTFHKINYVEIYLSDKFKWIAVNDGEKFNCDEMDLQTALLHELGHAIVPNWHGLSQELLNDEQLLKETQQSLSALQIIQARHTIAKVDSIKFCNAFGLDINEIQAKRLKLRYDNINSNNISNNNQHNHYYLTIIGILIVLLLISNVVVQWYLNIRKNTVKQGNKSGYAKVDVVSTESENDISDINEIQIEMS